ncbi:GNAT family N-acetyltransferase [Micromonospora sp. NBC_00421]|uniref:GNAT family N-acetyltransferase n=1 Tax=Micromonospora sp. NBC_00421 TaxID=2975976 RepID=UPI002E1CF37B
MLDRRLYLHLVTWLGQWPAGPGLHVVGSRRRARPAWDGRPRPAVAVRVAGSTVLSVPTRRVEAVRALAGGPRSALYEALPAAVGQPGWVVHDDVFRWCLAPAALPDVGGWTAPTDPAFPPWLHLFDTEVLVVRDADGGYLAGVGIKRHDAYGHELAVGTVPAARGRGLARRLVAQAARRVLDEGAVPTYRHDPGNIGSARVAEAAGFPDRGWSSYGVYPP